ncbi:MAG: transposase [Chloroflexi bacterium]|nr:transposase [Chloroflexota bacterium]
MTNPLPIYIIPEKQAEKQSDEALWEEVRRIFAGFETSAFTNELESVFSNLQDEELLHALETTRHTGRPGYPIRVMWHSLVTSYILDIPTIQGLIRRLKENPLIAIRCGIYSNAEIPSRFAYYRFIKKLIGFEDVIEKCMAKTVAKLKEKLPDLGETIAIDSADVPSYVSKWTKTLSDPDAKWGVKTKGEGNGKYWWAGYKLHLMGDAKYEIPLMSIVTPANESDTRLLIPLLKKAAEKLGDDFQPKYTLADRGYDSKENNRYIAEDMKSIPIILMVNRTKGNPSFEHGTDFNGQPHCGWGIPMIFWGYDKKQKRLKYRCPQACGKDGCTWIDKCSESSYGLVVKIPLKEDYRRYIQIPRHTKKWKKLYNKRVSVERIFSRLKKDGDGKLVNHRIRGLDKMTLNSLLSVWVMQVSSLGKRRTK